MPIMGVTKDDIRALAERIAEQFRPEQIILFGSRAEGRAGEDSDVDLLVVMPCEGAPWRTAARIAAAVHPGIFAIDLVVRTPEEMAWRYEAGDPFVRRAVDRGVVLYEAAA
jgi:uncharacterized protein